MASFDQVLLNVIASHLPVLFAASGHEKKDLWGRADSRNNYLPHGPNPVFRNGVLSILLFIKYDPIWRLQPEML